MLPQNPQPLGGIEMTTVETEILVAMADQHEQTALLLKQLAHAKEDGEVWALVPRDTSRTRTVAERCVKTGFTRSKINSLRTSSKIPVEGRIRWKKPAQSKRGYYSVTDAIAIFNQ